MRHLFFFFSCLVALLTTLLLPAVAHAQSTVAVTQFKEAKKLYDDEKYEDALQLFQWAWEYSHSPNARLYIARCFKALGKNKPAYDEFRGTLQDATDKLLDDDKYQGTQSAAAAELVILEPKIGHLIISLDAGDAKDVKVTLNGVLFPDVSLGSVITVDPGTMKIVASARGKEDVVREVAVAGGKTQAVALYFSPTPVKAPPAPPPPADDALSMSTLQLVGIAAGALGGGALIAAVGTGIAAGSKFSALKSACGEAPCPDPGYAQIIDSGKTFEVVSYVLLGAGSAVGIAGAALWIFGAEDEPQEPAATAIVIPVPGGVFIGTAGVF